jgi:hypothetical protein
MMLVEILATLEAAPQAVRLPNVRLIYERPEHFDLVIVLHDGGEWAASHDSMTDSGPIDTDDLNLFCQHLFDRGALRLLRHPRIKPRPVQPERIFA